MLIMMMRLGPSQATMGGADELEHGLEQIQGPSSLTMYSTSACELLGSGLTLIAYKYTRDIRHPSSSVLCPSSSSLCALDPKKYG